MADDVLITPASRKIEFKDADGNVDAVIQTDASGNLEVTNVGGDISIGDTTSDVYIGDGTNNVDIVFEQDGEIRGTSGVTVTLGASGATTNLAGTVQLGGTTLTATGTELNYTDGVTSNIQTQLDAKLPLAGGTMTGALDFGSVTGRVITITGDSGLDSADASIYLGNATYGFDIEYEGSGTANTNAFVITSTNSGSPKEVLRANQDGIAKFPNGTEVTGNITVSGTVDGRDVAADGTKLDGIENNATADQTASEILTAIKTVDGSGSGLDADTLDGQHASAFLKKNASIQSPSGNHTATVTDDLFLRMTSASGATLTIPNDSTSLWGVGQSFDVVQYGAGKITVSGASGVTVNGTPSLSTRAQYSVMTCMKVASNEWLVFGDVETP